jgi:hypothetical protein
MASTKAAWIVSFAGGFSSDLLSGASGYISRQ